LDFNFALPHERAVDVTQVLAITILLVGSMSCKYSNNSRYRGDPNQVNGAAAARKGTPNKSTGAKLASHGQPLGSKCQLAC
jgi:hypothetical protein